MKLWEHVSDGDIVCFRGSPELGLIIKAKMIDYPTMQFKLLNMTTNKLVIIHRDTFESLNGEIIARI